MSMKTNYLLRRSGRNQFGDHGEVMSMHRVGRTNHDDAMWKLHRDLHDQLVHRYGAAWLARFTGKTKKEVWCDLVGGNRNSPSLGIFYKMAKEYATFEEFLLYWLGSRKRDCLAKLGVPQTEIDAEMAKYTECGRFYVTFGAGKRLFGTMDRWRY